MFSTFCLALVVYTEARGEPLDGQLLVAEVVLNRVQMEQYPDDVCTVAFQQHQFSGLKDTPDLETILVDPAWQTSIEVAVEALAQRSEHTALQGPILGSGATHYHTTKVTPYWSKKLTRVGKYGRHIFYTGY
jgi:spore germination cell wall hydrolase CwlJ-like protein